MHNELEDERTSSGDDRRTMSLVVRRFIDSVDGISALTPVLLHPPEEHGGRFILSFVESHPLVSTWVDDLLRLSEHSSPIAGESGLVSFVGTLPGNPMSLETHRLAIELLERELVDIEPLALQDAWRTLRYWWARRYAFQSQYISEVYDEYSPTVLLWESRPRVVTPYTRLFFRDAPRELVNLSNRMGVNVYLHWSVPIVYCSEMAEELGDAFNSWLEKRQRLRPLSHKQGLCAYVDDWFEFLGELVPSESVPASNYAAWYGA